MNQAFADKVVEIYQDGDLSKSGSRMRYRASLKCHLPSVRPQSGSMTTISCWSLR